MGRHRLTSLTVLLALLVTGTSSALAQDLFTNTTANATEKCKLLVGIQSLYGHDQAFNQWNATFEHFLTEQTGLNCTFSIVSLENETAVYNAIGNATVDLIYSNPAMHVCLEEQYGVAAITSLISWQANALQPHIGLAVVALANRTDLNVLSDVVGKKITMGSLSLLAGWEGQNGALQTLGIDMFAQAKQVFYVPNITQGVMDVMSGRVDMAFVRADLLARLQNQHQLNASDFKTLSPVYVEGYSLPVTAPMPLYPEYSLDSLPHVNYAIRKAVAEALFRIQRADYPAQTGLYGGWTTPYSYNTVRELQTSIGLLQNGTCLRGYQLEDLIICQPGQIKLPLNQLRMKCAELGLDCPPGYGCICSPCIEKPPTAAASAFGGLRVGGFAVIMTVIPSLLVISLLLTLFYALRRHRLVSRIPNAIAYSELHVGPQSEVLGEGAHGLILKGNYCGVAVSVKRLMAASNPAYPSAFDFESVSKKSLDFGAGADYLMRANSAARAPRDAASPSQSRVQRRRSSFLQMVSDNLQVWSGKVPGSVDVTIRPTGRYRVRRRVQSAWTKLQCYLSNNVPWGDASALREARRRLMLEVSQRMQVRHPNVATVMGVSTEPVTEDPLLVMVCPERGALSNLIYNETVELDDEMVVTIMKDVAMGMKYLHFSKVPTQDEELTPKRVLIDANYRAQLMHFQLSVGPEEAELMLYRKGYRAPYWRAPEVLRGEAPSKASDVYAYGMLLYEVLYRREPFEKENKEEVLHAVADKNRKPPKRPCLNVPHGRCPAPQLVALMKECWHVDAAQRPDFPTIKQRLLQFASENFQCSADEALRLKHTKERALLDQILPPKVSAALREGRPVEPEPYDCVTIFFSDIVGFTSLSSRMQPQQVMVMLDRLYTILDGLTAKYGLFKVETIGDAYMVVGNLRNPQPDHASQVARFAMEAVQAATSILANEDDVDMGYLSIRAGIHSGPVIASVVGSTNPRYCLFGETVNAASRMESTSIANRIQMSHKAAELVLQQSPDLKQHIAARRRPDGPQTGTARTYWLDVYPEHTLMEPGRSPQGAQSTSNSARPSRRSSTGPQEALRETISGCSQLSVINGGTSPSRLSIASNMSEVLTNEMQAFSIEIPPDHPPTDNV